MRLFCLLLLTACYAAPQPLEPDDAYLRDLLRWKMERERNLRSSDGYLALAGMYWLSGEEQTFGSGADNDIVFPAGRGPERIGTFSVEDGRVRVRAEPGVDLLHDGLLVSTMLLDSDVEDAPTILSVGPLDFWVIERGGRLAVRLRDPESEVRRSFHGIDYYPASFEWIFEGRFQSAPPGWTLKLPNVLGGTYEESSPGVVVFEYEGDRYRLVCTGTVENLFVVFGDRTNGDGSYGGGRFLSIAPPDSWGNVYIDFNRAYNPPCAWSPYTTCPLPPATNELPFAVPAGERAPARY